MWRILFPITDLVGFAPKGFSDKEKKTSHLVRSIWLHWALICDFQSLVGMVLVSFIAQHCIIWWTSFMCNSTKYDWRTSSSFNNLDRSFLLQFFCHLLSQLTANRALRPDVYYGMAPSSSKGAKRSSRYHIFGGPISSSGSCFSWLFRDTQPWSVGLTLLKP